MEFLLGPLGSHRTYLTRIVFPNCVDFFDEVRRYRDGRQKTPDLYDVIRRFLTAVESVNNVPDYVHADAYFPDGAASVAEVREAIVAACPGMVAIGDIANAYKHCVRRPKQDVSRVVEKAFEIAPTSVRVDVSLGARDVSVKLEHGFDVGQAEQIMESVWKFWIEYENDVFALDLPAGGRDLRRRLASP